MLKNTLSATCNTCLC